MQGLTIIVPGADPARFHAALSFAAASAAKGLRTRLFLQAEAVALVRRPVAAPMDARYSAAGLPTLHELLEEATALGVRLIACQSGLALANMEAGDLPPGFETGGMMAALEGDDRIVAF